MNKQHKTNTFYNIFGTILFAICHVILSGFGFLVFLGNCMFGGCESPAILFYIILLLSIIAPILGIFSYTQKEMVLRQPVRYWSLLVPFLFIIFTLLLI